MFMFITSQNLIDNICVFNFVIYFQTRILLILHLALMISAKALNFHHIIHALTFALLVSGYLEAVIYKFS